MARGVQPDDAFTERFEELVPSAQAREAIMAGILATIVVVPDMGDPLDNKPGSVYLATIPEAPGWGIGKMTLFYSFDDECVYLRWLNPGVHK